MRDENIFYTLLKNFKTFGFSMSKCAFWSSLLLSKGMNGNWSLPI
jgi:hypothetical protein